MHRSLRLAALLLLLVPMHLHAQNLSLATPSAPLPDAPTPQTSDSQSSSQSLARPSQPLSPSQPAQPDPASSQSTTPQPNSQPSQPTADKTQTANQQLKQEESQRILGVLPQFNISYNSNVVSLTSKQKFSLALRTVVDPVTFATAFVAAGYREALDDNTGFRWGPEGYLRRTGASYLDSFDSIMIGNAALPALFHQEPRYLRLGHGPIRHRVLYSLATIVIRRHDNTGKWEPNYSRVLGNFAAGAISNLYYPSGTKGLGQTLTNGAVVTVEGSIGSLFDEFWPDISRKFLHKDPTHGADAAAAAAAQQPPPSASPQSVQEPPAPK